MTQVKKDQPPTAGLVVLFLCCLLNRVKTQLRIPKMQRATFLNSIVTANTVFLKKFIKKRYTLVQLASIFQNILTISRG